MWWGLSRGTIAAIRCSLIHASRLPTTLHGCVPARTGALFFTCYNVLTIGAGGYKHKFARFTKISALVIVFRKSWNKVFHIHGVIGYSRDVVGPGQLICPFNVILQPFGCRDTWSPLNSRKPTEHRDSRTLASRFGMVWLRWYCIFLQSTLSVRLNMIQPNNGQALSPKDNRLLAPKGSQARYTGEVLLRTRPRTYRKVVALLAAVHITLWFAFTMKRATSSKGRSKRPGSEVAVNFWLASSQCHTAL